MYVKKENRPVLKENTVILLITQIKLFVCYPQKKLILN